MSGLTPWYPISTNPHWDGNYEVDPTPGGWMRMCIACWDGWQWRESKSPHVHVMELPDNAAVMNFPPNSRWRGVTGAWKTRWGVNIDQRRALRRLVYGIDGRGVMESNHRRAGLEAAALPLS